MNAITYIGDEYGLESTVTMAPNGTYTVTLRDSEAGETVHVIRGFLALESATLRARALVASMTDEEAKASLRSAILGSYDGDADPMPGTTPQDRLRMQEHLGDFE